jgi:ribosomal protein L29
MDITLIQGAISGLKLASDIARGLLELKSISEVQGKVIELQSASLSAQSSALAANSDQFAMVEEIRTLKEEIARIKAWETEKKRYTLITPWHSGGVAYALKESMKESEPPHLICTKCYEDRRKSILNPVTLNSGFMSFACPVCKSQIPTGYMGGAQAQYAPD